MNYNEAQNFINSFSRLGAAVTDLSRIEGLLEKLGNPQDKLRFVHIAGTNGKGSTVEYISAALINAGYRTGQFTSPFVTHYADRIRVNFNEIDDKSLCEICGYVSEYTGDIKCSQFEITMCIALIYYVRENCDIVVLETGIGGLLDCTNVIKPPLVSVITSVSLDHTALLGNTIVQIASHKAGIIKQGSPVVLSADNDNECVEVVRKKAYLCGSRLTQVSKENIEVLKSDSYGNSFLYKGKPYVTSMSGVHQVFNAATAIEVCHILKEEGFNIGDDDVSDALKNTSVRARIQVIKGNPTVILDGGHNASGTKALSEVLKKYRKSEIYAVLGMVNTKDYVTSAKNIASVCGYVCCVDGFADNCVKADVLCKTISDIVKCEPSDYSKGIDKVKSLARENNAIAVICGSLYLASKYLNEKNQ